MTNKSKKQLNRYQDTQLFSKSEKEYLYSLQTAVIALNCCEPEPVYINGKYLYL
jgi:hypothetical protein